MTESWKNPNVDDAERKKYFWKKVNEEIKKFKDLSEDTGNGSFERRQRIYLQRISEQDHLTYRQLVYILFNHRSDVMKLDPYPIPGTLEWRELKEWRCIRLPGLVHKFRTSTKRFLSLVNPKVPDPYTGDGEKILINAKPRQRKEDKAYLEQTTEDFRIRGNHSRKISRELNTVGNMKTKERERELRRFIDEFF